MPSKKRFVLFLLSVVKLVSTILIVLYNDARLIVILLIAIVLQLAIDALIANNIKPKPGQEKKGCCGGGNTTNTTATDDDEA